jgi:sortase A
MFAGLKKYLPLAERVAWSAGVVLLGIYAVVRLEQARLSRADVARFETLRAQAERSGRTVLVQPPTPDFRLWTPSRIKAHLESLGTDPREPIALLEIPHLNLKAAVIEGTDEVALNRGLGHIEGTPRPGAEGNVGIAGHRDGVFRCLKDVVAGDELRLITPDGDEIYTVSETWIVTPEEVSVLAPTDRPSLTLVTCYPFYYSGNAPKRFIVRAYRAAAGGKPPVPTGKSVPPS